MRVYQLQRENENASSQNLFQAGHHLLQPPAEWGCPDQLPSLTSLGGGVGLEDLSPQLVTSMYKYYITSLKLFPRYSYIPPRRGPRTIQGMTVGTGGRFQVSLNHGGGAATSLEEHLDAAGFGWFQMRFFLILSSLVVADDMEMTMLSILREPFKRDIQFLAGF